MLSSAPRQTGPLRRPATRVPTVCVVDPNADDYRGWDVLAAAKGAKLQIVGSAEEALRVARIQAVDLWVVNTELPGLSGYELCSMLKGRVSRIPVYLVAEEYTPKVERSAWQCRATLFCCKPTHEAWLTQWLDHRSNCRAIDAAASLPTTV